MFFLCLILYFHTAKGAIVSAVKKSFGFKVIQVSVPGLCSSRPFDGNANIPDLCECSSCNKTRAESMQRLTGLRSALQESSESAHQSRVPALFTFARAPLQCWVSLSCTRLGHEARVHPQPPRGCSKGQSLAMDKAANLSCYHALPHIPSRGFTDDRNPASSPFLSPSSCSVVSLTTLTEK